MAAKAKASFFSSSSTFLLRGPVRMRGNLVFVMACLTLAVFLVLTLVNTSTSESESLCGPDGSLCEGNMYDFSDKGLYSDDLIKREKFMRDMILHKLQAHKSCIASNLECYRNVLESTLEPFKNGIEYDSFERAQGVKYQIINHKLYREDYCLFEARCNGVEHFLTELLPEFPDMEFKMNMHDVPRVPRIPGHTPDPTFSFSRNSAYADIMFPAWTFWEGGPSIWPLYPVGLGRWDLMRGDMLKSSQRFPWDKKSSKGYFRGSRTSTERDPLVLLSRSKPDLLDAQYTKNQAWKSLSDTLGMQPAEPVALVDHCEYKYLFNFKGVAASFRHKFLFLCGSLVFHVGNHEDDWLEFYYPAMKPWVHYVPVNLGLQDVGNLLSFFKRNDDLARSIATNGQKFIHDHLRMEDVKDYWRHLMLSYARLQKWTPKRDTSLVAIPKESHDEF